MKKRKLLNIIKETFKRKSLSRILTNIVLANFEAKGKILDMGGNRQASYFRFLKISKDSEIKILNIDNRTNPDFLVNMERDTIPLNDESFDVVFCFNFLKHVANTKNILKESYRVLRSGGLFLGSVPFLINVHPDPHDYHRFTGERLKGVLKEHGFKKIKVLPIGKGPYTAAYSQIEFTIPKILKPLFIVSAFGIDWFLTRVKANLKLSKKFVLGYIFMLKNNGAIKI